jgi:Rrf2 family protein
MQGGAVRISTKGRYALEAMLHIALNTGNQDTGPGQLVSVRNIADGTGITEGYLEQIIIALRKASLVRGERGPKGGYGLSRGPERISVGDILRATEGPLAPVACLEGTDCQMDGSCTAQRVWGELYGEITSFVDSVSLRNLIDAYAESGDAGI